MSCCPCFPPKKKYAKKLKEEGVKNNNKKKYKQKKGGKNVEMPAIAHTTDVHMDRTEEEKQKDVDAFRSMFKNKNTKRRFPPQKKIKTRLKNWGGRTVGTVGRSASATSIFSIFNFYW